MFYKQKFFWKVTEVKEVSRGRREPRKQVAEQKTSPWNLAERKQGDMLKRKKVESEIGRGGGVCVGDLCALKAEVFLWLVRGEMSSLTAGLEERKHPV